ncbi:MAG: HAD-IA family hydrolase [Patescibacteria group bacterium]|nr:MAG: HAD-IA family hydrolase [Patescibacteria group bacterium]
MPGKKLIWAVLSDLGRVVVDFDNRKACTALALHTPGRTAEELHWMIFEADYRHLWNACMSGHLAYPEYRKVMKNTFAMTCDDETFDRAISDVFTVNQPIVDLWRQVRRRHTRVITASNIEPVRHRQLEAMEVMNEFDAHCLSYQVMASKPQPEFFRRGLAIAGTEPDEALFVDDHEEFCEAARTVGMNAEVYNIRDHDNFVARVRERYLFA